MNIKKMTFSEFVYKLKNEIRYRMCRSHYNHEAWKVYVRRYSSYRHSLAHTHNGCVCSNYLAAVPNPGAGIGHQMANWMAGYYYAKLFGLKFAHIPFSNEHKPLEPNRWDDYLGFGEGEVRYKSLLSQGYKTVRLPLFNGDNPKQIETIRKIILSYSDQKVVFLCEQDQFLKDLYLVEDAVKSKFRKAKARQNELLKFSPDCFNIAVHVRRVVVINGKTIQEPPEVQKLRWLANDYYETVLKNVLENINPGKPIVIWLFSTGKAEEFAEFAKYGEVKFCNDMDEYQSFAHLIFSDLLITSKSSFSYKPAIMNDGIKVCPRNFWHGYPDNDSKWILCENDGSFDSEKLKKLF